jgi:hypothetical protein
MDGFKPFGPDVQLQEQLAHETGPLVVGEHAAARPWRLPGVDEKGGPRQSYGCQNDDAAKAFRSLIRVEPC